MPGLPSQTGCTPWRYLLMIVSLWLVIQAAILKYTE